MQRMKVELLLLILAVSATVRAKDDFSYTGACGRPKVDVDSSNIAGGTTAQRGAWPWQVHLAYTYENTGFVCGGTLIEPGWVVTAAHCVYKMEASPGYFTVTAGDHDRSKHEGSEQEVKVDTIFLHPEWNVDSMHADIALLQLRTQFKVGTYVQPACYPSQDVAAGTQCYITGWGNTNSKQQQHEDDSVENECVDKSPNCPRFARAGYCKSMVDYMKRTCCRSCEMLGLSDVLQQAEIPIVSKEACKKKNIALELTKNSHVDDSMICMGSEKASACHGDAGGPLVCKVHGKWELHGSISQHSFNCKSSEAYSVAARTKVFKDWIKHTIQTAY